jgi:hypothetical protein
VNGAMKWSPIDIVKEHYGTFEDASTRQVRLADYVQMAGMPALIGLFVAWRGVGIDPGLSLAMVTVSGLLSAFLFGLMIQVAARAMEWADLTPAPGRATSRQAVFLEQLAANAAYGSLLSIVTAGAFIACAETQGRSLQIASAVAATVGAHLVLTQLMVMKRVFALTKGRLIAARTTHQPPHTGPDEPPREPVMPSARAERTRSG